MKEIIMLSYVSPPLVPAPVVRPIRLQDHCGFDNWTATLTEANIRNLKKPQDDCKPVYQLPLPPSPK